ncbi:MAG: laccase [Propionibacteriales bacterium]|nr:laccase [Propionibacteriales bacterium]
MFCFRDTFGSVEIAFTDRHGGVSSPPFDTLNLGAAPGDSPEDVEHNYEILARELDTDPGTVARMHQMHDAEVAVLRQAPPPGSPPRVDALVTDVPGLVISARVADCVPVLLADPEAGVVGCAHAGRSGMAAGVVPNTVRGMRELGADRITAWVGPYVCGACYEVPEAMQADVVAAVPASRSMTSWGTPALDLGAGVESQLREAGCSVTGFGSWCTRETPDLYSHRRDGPMTGRSAGLVRIRR